MSSQFKFSVFPNIGSDFVKGVKTGNLNKAVRRNQFRFPEDSVFQLTEIEEENLIFQIGISSYKSEKHGGTRHLPLVFTEQGVAVLSSVLKSERAALVNIEIIRTFVKIRGILLSNHGLAHKLAELEKKYDSQFKAVFDAIKQLMSFPEKPKKEMGIHSKNI